MADTELDYMEYANDGLAQAAYVSSEAEKVKYNFESGGDSGSAVGDAAGADYYVGNKIVVSAAIVCTGASIYFSAKTGNPSGNLTFRIETDAAGEPSGTLAHANATNTLAGHVENSWNKVAFTPFSLVAGTYWLVVYLPDQAANNYHVWHADADGGTNTRAYSTDHGANWAIDNLNSYFRLYGRVLQCFSESTIIRQGTYSLKGIAKATDSLNKTLTRTVDPTIDLSDLPTVYFHIKQSSIAGSIKVGIHDSGGTTTEKTVTVAGHAITFAGTAELDTAEKKWGTASLLLDGNSDYLTIPDSADWDICGSSTDDWTLDFFVKHTDHVGIEYYWDQWENDNNRLFFYHQHGMGITFYVISGGSGIVWFTAGTEITDTNWHHVALIKVADEYGIYLDGTQIGYKQDSDTDTFAGTVYVGVEKLAASPRNYLDGQMDDIRLQHSNVFGAAPNDTPNDTITPPTGAHTGDANTKLLLHLDGADEATATIDSSRDYWQPITWDISGVSNANKDVIDSIIVTILNADNDNTFYLDNMYGLVVEVANFMLGCNF